MTQSRIRGILAGFNRGIKRPINLSAFTAHIRLSLPLHAKGGGCVVGLTYSDNALFGKDDSSAVPMGGSLRSHTDRIAFLVPGDACRRGTAFGYEPGR